jgi:hypothetical protein
MAEDKGQMPPSYFSQEKVQTVLDMIDGSRTVSEIIDGSGLRRIETCAVLSQLVRASAVDVGVVD